MKNEKLLVFDSFRRLHVRRFFEISVVLFLLFTFRQSSAQGTWTALRNPAPIPAGGGAVLLTDGRVMCKGYYNGIGFPGTPDSSWMVLTPDIHGSYVNGTWTVLQPEHDTRSVFSSQVLPSGNVFLAGGEHGTGVSSAEIYNTNTNTWKYIPNVPRYGIYDANSELLYDGTVLVGCAFIWNPDTTILLYNPAAGTLRAGPASIGSHEETSWIKLPDSSILYVDVVTTNSERYIPKQHKWVADANVPVQLYDNSSEETGPAVLLPNGKAFFIGDVGYTAIYTPSGNINPGTWTIGPNEPISVESQTQLGSWDGPCAMMVNGKVLCSISPLASESLPSYFYEYDYVSNTFARVGTPGGWGDSVETQTNMMTMLDLPDGNVLFAYTDSTKFYIYTPSGSPIAQGIPTIDGVLADSCNKYMITGKLFNGISEGAEFGDDWQMSTNYPIVRVTDGTNVYYAKTFNWNRLGAVMTGNLEDTAYFTFPNVIPGGTYSLVVVANGFPSNPTPFSIFGFTVTSKNINCATPLGSAYVKASNGASPYTYLWQPVGSTKDSITGLSAGTYTIIVTQSGGCSESASVTIKHPPILLNPAITEVSCHGGTNGTVAANASGGTMPYTYLWQGGATTSSISGLSAGKYSLSVSDSCGLITTTSVTITQPGALKIPTVSVTNLECNGDTNAQASITPDSGSAPYTYLWQNGDTTSTIGGLSTGTYSVVVHDSCGATATASFTITAPPALTGIIDSVNSSSADTCDGKAWVISSGGTPPYTYYWTTGGQTTDTIEGQCPGNYCCVVTDNNGCFYYLCVNIFVTGIANVNSANDPIKVYPNPNTGVFRMQLPTINDKLTVEIYNVVGQKVYSQLSIGNVESIIDLSSQPNGLYFYRVISENWALIGEGKVIVQK